VPADAELSAMGIAIATITAIALKTRAADVHLLDPSTVTIHLEKTPMT
jgi:hypothetical protein